MNTVNDAAGSDHIINYGIPNIIDDILALPAPVIFNIANSNEDLLVPRDLAFHPDLSRNELWVLNKDTEASGSSTVKFTNVGEDGSADCAIEAGRVEAAGGKLHQAKMSIGEYGNIALAFDTEGNMFGLHSMG